MNAKRGCLPAGPTRRPEGTILPLGGDRYAAIGTDRFVGAFLRRARHEGVLLGSSDVVPAATIGRYVVNVRIARYRRPAPLPTTWRSPERLVPVVLVAGTVAVVGVALWLVLAALSKVAASAGVLALLAVLIAWALAGQAGACPGLHCPGCKCGR